MTSASSTISNICKKFTFRFLLSIITQYYAIVKVKHMIMIMIMNMIMIMIMIMTTIMIMNMIMDMIMIMIIVCYILYIFDKQCAR